MVFMKLVLLYNGGGTTAGLCVQEGVLVGRCVTALV